MIPLAHLRVVPRCVSSRRSIFTLPDLSSLSPFSGSDGKGPQEIQTYHERKIFPYKPSQLHSLVSDIESYPRFLPFCTGARILSRTPASVNETETFQAEMTVGFLTFKESYVSDVKSRPNEYVEVVASSSTPLFKTLNTTWRFQPASPQSPHPSWGSSLPDPPSAASSAASPAAQRDAGPTLVTLDLAFSFANPVHAAVSATFFGQVSKMMVKAFEKRCLDIYGPGNK